MVILFGLLLLSVWFLFYSLRLAGKKPAQIKTEAGVMSEEAFWTETTDLLEKFRLAELPAYYHPTKRDPMQPTGSDSAQPFKLMVKGTPYSLTGIMVGSDKTAAIIDEKICRVGDTVETWKIVAIEKDRVLLADGIRSQILKLGKTEFSPL